jgi:hypothetical protein
MSTSSKYYLLPLLLLGSAVSNAQPNANQAVVTIVGDPIQSDNNYAQDNNDFLNNDFNPYQDNNTNPPTQQQSAQLNQGTIEPTLENGFHVRFNLESAQPVERMSSSGYMSTGGSSSAGGAKSKKHVTMAERTFNAKKKIKCWLPKRKKRYRPHLCGRF